MRSSDYKKVPGGGKGPTGDGDVTRRWGCHLDCGRWEESEGASCQQRRRMGG
jgi:hypothetical protein